MPVDLPFRQSASRGHANLGAGAGHNDPPTAIDTPPHAPRRARGLIGLKRSPLARKIIAANLLALVVLVAGMMMFNPARESLVAQRENALVVAAGLIAQVLEASIAQAASTKPFGPTGVDAQEVLGRLPLPAGIDVQVYALPQQLIASTDDIPFRPGGPNHGQAPATTGSSPVIHTIDAIWSELSALFGRAPPAVTHSDHLEQARTLVASTAGGRTVLSRQSDAGGSVFFAASPVFDAFGQVGAVVVRMNGDDIDALVRAEQERFLRMFFIAMIVSIGFSLALASTIAHPLADLAAAAELGRDKTARKMGPSQVRIPDLTGRPDEIGRLSGALRGMVSALHDLIDSNEQFAADVSHEIKNPLASLRSAVGTLRLAKSDDQRNRLLAVIEHDVQRMDRLVSDISNASRLDSELVKETEEDFDLVHTVRTIAQYHSQECDKKGVALITDMPPDPIRISGLEGRLAQVFVNLLSNAISFCKDGDAVRLWIRRRDNRVLIVVDDTGPGIPEEALSKVFNRFYSERPEHQFGHHSGLGLAISKQIVEAHGGVIWAENIRSTDADPTSDPLGARFVVGLPV